MQRIAKGLPRLLAAALLLAGCGAAEAHPHVFIDARVELAFNPAGEIVAVHHVWQFDKAFTAMAVQGLDVNNDGLLSDSELAPLAKLNIDSLKDYAYFTFLRSNDKPVAFDVPKDYWLQFVNGRLTLFFSLPLKAPVAARRVSLDVYDPEYFVAITFPGDATVDLEGAPGGCKTTFRPPSALDAGVMNQLAAIPADQHDLPPELTSFALALANRFSIACP